MFRAQARLLRFRPQNGMQVIIRGRITMYEARGEMQLLAEYMEPMGAGALQVAFEQLKAKLAAEGLFAPERKKPLPLLPRRIGVITSPRGAVIQDILNVLQRRHQSLNVLIYPAQVQGESAAAEVSAGIRFFNQQSRQSRQTISPPASSPSPSMSSSSRAVEAASKTSPPLTTNRWRAPSPPAASPSSPPSAMRPISPSAILSPTCAPPRLGRRRDRHPLPAGVAAERRGAARASAPRHAIQVALPAPAPHLAARSNRVFARMEDAIARRQQRLDDLRFRLESLLRARLGEASRRLDLAALAPPPARSAAATPHAASVSCSPISRPSPPPPGNTSCAAARAWSRLRGKLAALSPVAILERGYSLIFDAQGTLVKDASQLQPGDAIHARLARGQLHARVESRALPETEPETKAE